MRSQKGITLIALVITIIVMLILVAVTITMAVNGGLFEYAGRAGTKTNQAVANEQEFANLEANMTVNQLINKYTSGETSRRVTFTIDGVEFTADEGTKWKDWLKNQNANDLIDKGVKSEIQYIISSPKQWTDKHEVSVIFENAAHACLALKTGRIVFARRCHNQWWRI